MTQETDTAFCTLQKTLSHFVYIVSMKVLLAFASGWIAFSLADQAIYGGRHVRLFAGFIRAVAAGFGYYF